MSKQVKKMQMDVLAKTFRTSRTWSFCPPAASTLITDNKIRLGLRKKNISLLMVKNSLLRRVFTDLGVTPGEDAWAGPTLFAWGAESVKDLSREVETALLKDAKAQGQGQSQDGAGRRPADHLRQSPEDADPQGGDRRNRWHDPWAGRRASPAA